jgi:hypothetical protein
VVACVYPPGQEGDFLVRVFAEKKKMKKTQIKIAQKLVGF